MKNVLHKNDNTYERISFPFDIQLYHSIYETYLSTYLLDCKYFILPWCK